MDHGRKETGAGGRVMASFFELPMPRGCSPSFRYLTRMGKGYESKSVASPFNKLNMLYARMSNKILIIGF